MSKLDKAEELRKHIAEKEIPRNQLERILAVYMVNVHVGIQRLMEGKMTPEAIVVAEQVDEEVMYKVIDKLAEKLGGIQDGED